LLRRAFWCYRAWSLRGDRFECPCCGGYFRSLLPAGVVRRPNACCPRCGSLERHRLIWLYVQRRTDLLTKSHRVLMVAPEETLQRKLRGRPNLEFLSIDLESPLAMRRMDITRLELPDASYDVIFCNHVFEHIPEDRAAMRELRRVLKPGGWAILQTPVDRARATTDEDPAIVDPSERLRRFGQADHVRRYGRDFFNRLRQAGWAVERNSFVHELRPEEIASYALWPDEELIIGHA
ncbi:MAG: class I SAM-dependent methyltransferase, partial [Patescibacteria group bacterium]